MDDYKIIIAGGREFTRYEDMESSLDFLINAKRNTHNIVIISGTASGADSMGEAYANRNGLDEQP